MNDEQAQRIIGLLEEIRNGQRLQLERQSQALERQAELLARQRERLAGVPASVEAGAEQLLARSAKLVASARLLTFIAAPAALLLLAFLIWVLIAHVQA